MRKPAYSAKMNAAIILWGVRAGLYALVVTTGLSLLFGILISLIGGAGAVHLGEYQPWMPIIGLEYGFLLGIVVSFIFGWITCRSCLRKNPLT